MELKGIKVGFALTGSYCTLDKTIPYIGKLIDEGADVFPIMSENTYNKDSRFGKASHFINRIEEITGSKIKSNINEVEPIGPKKLIDILIIVPCTGNTLAKLSNGITDTSVTMAAKAQLRNGRPVVIGVSTNDGLSANAVNIGLLMNKKNIFFVPFRQDNPYNKETSLIADYDNIIPTLKDALDGKQHQPVILGSNN